MKLYVWRLSHTTPAEESRPWIVSTIREVLAYHPTHAGAFADAWARTHPKEETP